MSKDILVQSTIEKICIHYANKENVIGILKVVNKRESGIEEIKLIIIYEKLTCEPNYFGFNNGSDKHFICDDVVLLIDSRESIEFGLLGLFNFYDGKLSACNFLANGEIIYDKTGKYKELKKSIRNDNSLKKKSLKRTTIPARV